MKLLDLKVLSEQEIKLIHEASINILENTGIVVHSRRILELLDTNDAIIDYDKKLVKLPGKLVEDCLKKIPEVFNLYDRNGNKSITIGDGITKCCSGCDCIYIIDANTNERRKAALKDVENFALISENLKNIDIVAVPFITQDVHAKTAELYGVKCLYENTTKPILFATESSSVTASIIQFMKIIVGKEDITECPTAIGVFSPISPLYWSEEVADALIEASNEGVPVTILPEPMPGITAPYSLAGMLTINNTEVLSGVVISQLVRPGAPIMYGSTWTSYDMKRSMAIIGSPETSILGIAGRQMAEYYNMPAYTTAPNSDSNTHDEENSWEKTISAFCSICAGNDVIVNLGIFATGLTISLEQLVLDDELAGIIRRVHNGISVNQDTIGINIINNVGPRGNFLMEDHTLKYLRSEEFRESKLPNSTNYEKWIRSGSPDIVRNANKIVKDILRDGNNKPLDDNCVRRMSNVIKEFEKKYEE